MTEYHSTVCKPNFMCIVSGLMFCGLSIYLFILVVFPQSPTAIGWYIAVEFFGVAVCYTMYIFRNIFCFQFKLRYRPHISQKASTRISPGLLPMLTPRLHS